jgi:UDP-glucose 4-epimerase
VDSVNDYEAHRGRSAWNHFPYTNAFGGWCMRALVTGGAGFIGSHLIDRLVARGDHVVVLDNLSSGNLDFIQGHLDSGDAVLVNGDLRSLDDVKQAMAMDIDCVYHLAANPDIRLGTRVTDTDLNQGTVATYNVVEAMRLAGVKKIAFASSSVVYGENAPMPTPENHGPCMPISLYGASKQAGEGLISSWVGTFGLQAWIFRFANVVGARGTHGVIFDFIHKLKNDPTRLEVLGNGLQEKSYMEVGDCVDAILHVMATTNEPLNLFNLGSHDTASVRRIAEIVVEVTDCADARIEYTGGDRGWAGDIPRARLAIERMVDSGFDVRMNSEDAIRHTATCLLEEIGLEE